MTAAQTKSFGMSTVMTHKAFGKYAEESLRAVCYEAERLEGLLSRFIPRSDISRVNRSAGIKWERLGNDAYEVLSQAAELSVGCQGIFDVTIGPLVALWSYDRAAVEPPKDSRIQEILPLVSYTDLLLDPCEKAAKLLNIGQSIDLGGIGKGYAGDKFLEIFKKYDISSAFTNIGGNVVALGTKPDGSPWSVGIRHPRQENSLIGIVYVADKAVVTSGDYQRYFFGSDGKRYHHILDPSKGYPADSGLVSATIVAGSSTVADALSTALFIAGMESGLELLKRFPGTEAILVDQDLQVHITAGLTECFRADADISLNIINEEKEKFR